MFVVTNTYIVEKLILIAAQRLFTNLMKSFLPTNDNPPVFSFLFQLAVS